MSHAQFIDEMVKEYLLFRGFTTTLKALDMDLKSDKEKSFRVDKIIDQIMHYIHTYDLNSFRELWNHFHVRLFSKLESHMTSAVKKLENGTLKLYLINCIANSKPDKMNDFFVKMTPELQNQQEWKEWFVIPYIKNVEDNPTFSLYFTKQWQDTLLLSLHNFLAITFHHMPMPTLMRHEEDVDKVNKLEQKNESLRDRLAMLIDKEPGTKITPFDIEPPAHLLDDFYIIAQENKAVESQVKGLRSLIRNMGSGGSPILGRKDTGAIRKKRNQ